MNWYFSLAQGNRLYEFYGSQAQGVMILPNNNHHLVILYQLHYSNPWGISILPNFFLIIDFKGFWIIPSPEHSNFAK